LTVDYGIPRQPYSRIMYIFPWLHLVLGVVLCLGFVLGAYLCLPTVCNACSALLSMETDREQSWWHNAFSPAKREAVATAWQCMMQWGQGEERPYHTDAHIPVWITPKHRILIQRIPLTPRPLHDVTEFNQPWMAGVLLALGADPDARNADDSTPLHLTVPRNNLAVAERLLRYGADPDARNADDSTPLHLTVSYDKPAVAEMLLRYGADLNARNAYDSTPLHFAAARDNLAMAEMLLRYGADPKAQDEWGQTPLAGALWGRENKPDMAMVNLLRDRID